MNVTYDDVGGVKWAIVKLTAPAAEVLPRVLRELAGYRVVTEDDELARLLLEAGGVVRRRAHDYVYDLSAVPDEWAELVAPHGFSLSNDLDAVALAPSHEAANPPGSADYEEGMDHVRNLRELLSGEVIGAVVREAAWQLSDGDGPCGGIIVAERRDPGTWVLDVWVHPRHQGRGLGSLLLRRSLAGAARAGYPAMGLVVTDGNPARAAYEAVGFRLRLSGASIDVPGADPGAPPHR